MCSKYTILEFKHMTMQHASDHDTALLKFCVHHHDCRDLLLVAAAVAVSPRNLKAYTFKQAPSQQIALRRIHVRFKIMHARQLQPLMLLHAVSVLQSLLGDLVKRKSRGGAKAQGLPLSVHMV